MDSLEADDPLLFLEDEGDYLHNGVLEEQSTAEGAFSSDYMEEWPDYGESYLTIGEGDEMAEQEVVEEILGGDGVQLEEGQWDEEELVLGGNPDNVILQEEYLQDPMELEMPVDYEYWSPAMEGELDVELDTEELGADTDSEWEEDPEEIDVELLNDLDIKILQDDWCQLYPELCTVDGLPLQVDGQHPSWNLTNPDAEEPSTAWQKIDPTGMLFALSLLLLLLVGLNLGWNQEASQLTQPKRDLC